MKPVRAVAALVASASVTLGCAGGDRPSLGSLEPAPTPTPTAAPEEVPASSGTFVVGDRRFELEFRCFDVDGTSTVAVGKGTDPESGDELTALVQQFESIDYIALVFGDVESGRAWEPSVEVPISIERTGDRFAVEALEFVEYTDGVGERIGSGSVEVICRSFEQDVPESVFLPPPS